jgi:hypothetical protein
MPVTSSGDYIPPETEKIKSMSNTKTLFSEIKKLTNEAISSYNTKPKAKPYIERLIFLRSYLPKISSIRAIFDKLVNHTAEASGQVRNKEHWLGYVTQDLILLEWEFKRFNLLPDTYNS